MNRVRVSSFWGSHIAASSYAIFLSCRGTASQKGTAQSPACPGDTCLPYTVRKAFYVRSSHAVVLPLEDKEKVQIEGCLGACSGSLPMQQVKSTTCHSFRQGSHVPQDAPPEHHGSAGPGNSAKGANEAARAAIMGQALQASLSMPCYMLSLPAML